VFDKDTMQAMYSQHLSIHSYMHHDWKIYIVINQTRSEIYHSAEVQRT